MHNKEHSWGNPEKAISHLIRQGSFSNEEGPSYQEALRKSGYSYTLKFTPLQQQSPEPTTKKRMKQRNMIRFNPPFNRRNQTNIGREFLNLIEKCFQPNHKLRKLFNKNNPKLIYSCSPNIKQQTINAHNKRILRHTIWKRKHLSNGATAESQINALYRENA